MRHSELARRDGATMTKAKANSDAMRTPVDYSIAFAVKPHEPRAIRQWSTAGMLDMGERINVRLLAAGKFFFARRDSSPCADRRGLPTSP